MSEQLPPVIRAASVRLPPERAFAVFTEEMGAWWPLRTHSVFGERSGGVRFIDGRLVEVAIDGAEATWAEVLSWEPPKGFAVAWHPGSPDGPASRVEVTFEAIADGTDQGGTKIEIRHDGWEAFGRDGMERRRGYAGPAAWGSVLDHYSDCTEPYPLSAEAGVGSIGELAEQYEAFFAEAERGGFGPAPEGEWGAEQVIAHVALNDLAMAAVSQAVIHQGRPTFENHTCQQPENLARVIGECGDLTGVIAFGRWAAAQAMAAVSRLNTEQQLQLVACKMEHDGQVVMEDARPWAALAVGVQAGMHLPAHIGQLQDLRS